MSNNLRSITDDLESKGFIVFDQHDYRDLAITGRDFNEPVIIIGGEMTIAVCRDCKFNSGIAMISYLNNGGFTLVDSKGFDLSLISTIEGYDDDFLTKSRLDIRDCLISR